MSNNAAGYILHRAFIDGGEVKKGFFFDKYLMSWSNKAVKGGKPLSLTYDTKDTSAPSKDRTYNPNCRGRLYDAITISKKRGRQYNCASSFMYAALAMLSFAQGLKAQSTDICAWYDASGKANFPKVCNNKELGDADDPEIRYANSDTKLKIKPNTGSANYFARTTHNGQNCGVCDLNGCIWQVALGLIKHSGTNYLMQESARLTDFTPAKVESCDTKLYESVSGIDSDVTEWGNSSHNAFYSAQQGQQRALCGLIPAATGGTHEFGHDLYRNDATFDAALVCGGGWAMSRAAGLWFRDLRNNYSWSYSSFYWGFRAAAY